MLTLQRQLSLSLLLILTFGDSAYGQELPEEVIPSIVDIGSVESQQSPTPELELPKVAIVIRIPVVRIAKYLNQDFQNTEAVNRKVLGTRSTGQAKCHGSVSCTLEENAQGATFCCRIEGKVRSETCGTNGPAIIRSTASTSYVALKQFVFHGGRFRAKPATITLTTDLKITGIASSLPGLRGRIVRRVASGRAQQSHAQAEAITTAITCEELSQRIDKEFDGRLNELNRRLAPRLSLIEHFRAAGNEIFVRSFSDSVEIGLVHLPLSRHDVAIHHIPMTDSIELWIGNGRAEQATQTPLPTNPTIASLIVQAPHWLATYFSNYPQLSKLDEKTLSIWRQDDWIVMQLLD